MSASETRYAQRLVALQTEADAIDASLRAMDCVEPYVRSVGLSGDGPRAAAAKPSAPSDALPEFSARDQRQLEQEVLARRTSSSPSVAPQLSAWSTVASRLPSLTRPRRRRSSTLIPLQ